MAWRGEVEDGLGWGGLVASKSERREEARLAALERDAARYRWLCDGSKQDEMGVWIVKDGAVTHYLSDEEVDEAIDAAMNGANVELSGDPLAGRPTQTQG